MRNLNCCSAGSVCRRGPIAALFSWCFAVLIAVSASTVVAADAKAPSPEQVGREARAALLNLYARVPQAKELGPEAHAILVFPKMTKAGFVVGGQYGEGALLKGDKVVALYSSSGLSYGLQAGAQQYGYAMFFMNEQALSQLDTANGFEIGVGPSVVVIDEGMAKSTTTKTMKDDIYAFVFGQKGLMAGLGLQGNKITRLKSK